MSANQNPFEVTSHRVNAPVERDPAVLRDEREGEPHDDGFQSDDGLYYNLPFTD